MGALRPLLMALALSTTTALSSMALTRAPPAQGPFVRTEEAQGSFVQLRASPRAQHPRVQTVALTAPNPPGSPTEEEQARTSKLLICILIDLIGMLTYLLPVAGEAGDLAWAPISALLINQLFGNGFLTGLAFAEELLPGLDIIPTATIAWLLENTDVGQQFNSKASSVGAPSPPTPGGTGPSKAEPGMKRADGVVVDD